MKIIGIGEILWDLIGAEEYLGGAPFNFAAHAARLGHDVSFVSAVGNDARGDRALARAEKHGLSSALIKQTAESETGIVDVVIGESGHPSYTIPRPAAYDFPVLSDDEIASLAAQQPDRIYFGTLQQTRPDARQLTRKLVQANPATGRFYDVNLRKDCYNAELISDLLGMASVVKLNDDEAVELAAMLGLPSDSLEQFCLAGKRLFGWAGVCVTRAERGCSLLLGDEYLERPGQAVRVADTVGAGDAFSAALLHGMAEGWDGARIADFANRVGALVASRAGATPAWELFELP